MRNLSRSNRRGGLGCSIALVLLLVGTVAGAVLAAPTLLDLLNNPGHAAPLTAAASPATERATAQRAAAVAQLNSYGWVDKEKNVARIPIGEAIALAAEVGFPVGEASSADTESTGATSGESSAIDLSTVSFDDVLPIFVERCGRCHGDDDPAEGLILTSYEDALRGSDLGTVIKPGDPDGSYLVEQVVSGQMPKRADDLPQSEIDVIVAWIAAGAPEYSSASTATATPATDASSIDLENVGFQQDVLPILIEHCERCHGDDDPGEGLVLTSYADVMRGSDLGSVVRPGDPDGSYLVEQIVTGKMPKRGEDLSQSEIDIIVAWIAAGAEDN